MYFPNKSRNKPLKTKWQCYLESSHPNLPNCFHLKFSFLFIDLPKIIVSIPENIINYGISKDVSTKIDI